MIRAFWKSKLAVGAVMVVCLGLAVAVWLRDREYPVYIPAIASLLLLGIGYFAGRLLGNLVAGTQNTRCLGLLHLDLDPQAFLAEYKQIPGRLNPNSRDFPIASACLADGYAAAGEFDQAIETLCGAFRNVKKGDQALRALYYNNLCGYALSKEDLVLARQAEQKLEQIVKDCRDPKSALSENMALNLRIHQNRRVCLEGGRVETSWLEEQLPQSTYRMRRLDLLQLLAMWCLRSGKKQAAQDYLLRLRQEAGKTWYGSWAAERQLASDEPRS